jgi:hypothetical protein
VRIRISDLSGMEMRLGEDGGAGTGKLGYSPSELSSVDA